MHKMLGLIAIATLVTACGEFSYKRGANVAQLENTRQSCQAKVNAEAVEKCMKDNGWTIQKLDSFEIFTEAEPKSDEQSEVETAENTSDLTTENAQKTGVTETVVADKQQTATNPSAKPKTKVASSNPLDTYVVSSWWKSGVRPDAFQVDSNMCVEKLGEAHKPIGKTQTVTVGFISCMNEKGWKALKKLR